MLSVTAFLVCVVILFTTVGFACATEDRAGGGGAE